SESATPSFWKPPIEGEVVAVSVIARSRRTRPCTSPHRTEFGQPNPASHLQQCIYPQSKMHVGRPRRRSRDYSSASLTTFRRPGRGGTLCFLLGAFPADLGRPADRCGKHSPLYVVSGERDDRSLLLGSGPTRPRATLDFEG